MPQPNKQDKIAQLNSKGIKADGRSTLKTLDKKAKSAGVKFKPVKK